MTTTSAGLATAAYEELAAILRGELITPGDPGYDSARAVYNAMIDKRPAAIARCRDTADVISCVRFAREHGVEIAVRGGGHNAAGLGVWDDALVIDLSPMRSTTVEPARPHRPRRRRLHLGQTSTTRPWRSAWPPRPASSPPPGSAGLTLGGGIGYLSRRFGLTVDNLLSADVVLADGTFVTASESSHSDLFWALRGGGGNFGIVTSFTFRCHDIGEHGTIIGGPVLYDFADTAEVMRWYRELLPSLPEELNGWIALLTIPPAPPFPRGAVGPQGVRHRLVLHRTARPRRRGARAGQDASARRCSSACSRCRSPRCRARSTPCTRPGCSGTGGRTSSTRSPTPRSTCTSSTARSCRPATRPCTCTRSTAPPAASPPDATAFAYRDGGWAGVIVGVDPDPGQRRPDLAVGPRLLAGAAPDLGRRRATSTS